MGGSGDGELELDEVSEADDVGGGVGVVLLVSVSLGGSEVVDVSSAGIDVDDVSSGGATVAVSVLESSSCLCRIPFPSRPATLTLTKVASATDMAESPKTRSSSALESCIVADLSRDGGRTGRGLLREKRGAKDAIGEEKTMLVPLNTSLLRCQYEVSLSFGDRPGLNWRFRVRGPHNEMKGLPCDRVLPEKYNSCYVRGTVSDEILAAVFVVLSERLKNKATR